MRTHRHSLFLLPAALVGALVLAAPEAARADDWAVPGLDAARSRLSAERSGAAFTDGRWSFTPSTTAGALASPVVAEGYAVSVDLDGTVNVVRADDGHLVWSTAAGAVVAGTPAIAHGRLFVPTIGGKLLAFALADGAALWTAEVGGMIMSSPAPVGSDIIFAAGFPQHRVVRLDGATGALVWRSAPVIDQPGNSSPAVAGGLVVVGSNGGHYFAFDAATGASRWDYQADGVVHLASPLIAGGRVYMAGGDHSDQVHAVDAATGTAISGWPVSLPSPAPDLAGTPIDRHRAVSSFTSVAGNLVIETRLDDLIDTDDDGVADQYLSRETVVALDASSGLLVWQHPLARAVFTDFNQVPKQFACPTPAAFGVDGGSAASGGGLFAGGAREPPRRASGADDGDLTGGGPRAGLAGDGQRSPHHGRREQRRRGAAVVGEPPADGADAGGEPAAARRRGRHPCAGRRRWISTASSRRYELRIDSDGEVLQSYAQQIFPGQGATSVAVTAPLVAGGDLHRSRCARAIRTARCRPGRTRRRSRWRRRAR